METAVGSRPCQTWEQLMQRLEFGVPSMFVTCSVTYQGEIAVGRAEEK